MQLDFDPEALDELLWWTQNDHRTATKIIRMIVEVRKTPFTGTGKPEKLKHDYAGCWSRRINQEHRLIYKVEGERLTIISCSSHYGDR